MKRLLAILLGLCLLAAAMGGCTADAAQNSTPVTSAAEPGEAPAGEKISVVSTIFAPYDFVREIAGDKVDLTMLLPPGAESHSYEPTPQDIIKIQNCDVFLYAGGDSDNWVKQILESMDTSGMKIVTLMDCVDTVEEEVVEGMEDSHGHDHGGEEFDEANVKDRPMSDFAGTWVSAIPLILDGSLDAFLAHAAEEAEVTFEEQKDTALKKWASDYDNIEVGDGTLTIGGVEAKYAYKGYAVVESDHGTSVWYQYQVEKDTGDRPQYLLFNDHQYASGGEKEEIPHMHMRYGNDGFAALLDAEGATFYFDASFTNEEIGAFMAGDAHSHEEHELDEHVWTSPGNAKRIVQKISDALCKADSGNAATYEQNTAAYLGKLDELDASFRAVVDGAAQKTIVFGDRFPFRYLADAYGLDYFAAFTGCSTQTEASAATVAFLIDKVNEEHIPVVFHIELSNEKMADTICEETGAAKLLLHACHNVSKDELAAGATYLSLMNQNVQNLKEALQ